MEHPRDYLGDDDGQGIPSILERDILMHTCPLLDGMSWPRGWTYSGGHGLAGLHAEDAFLDYGHWLLDLQLTLEEGSLTKRVVTIMQKLSSKVWVYSGTGGVNRALELNKIVGGMMGIDEENCFGDEHLVDRQFVLDPRLFREGVAGFNVVVQKNGEFVVGNTPHAVLGCGFFSVACNFAFKEHLDDYILSERHMAAAIRSVAEKYMEVRTRMNDNVEPIIRPFVFTSAMLEYFETNCLRKGTYIPVLRDPLRRLYEYDSSRQPGTVPLLVDDLIELPISDVDNQCEQCGIGFVCVKYCIPGREAKKGVCVDCMGTRKVKGITCVSLFNGRWARRTGLVRQQ